MDMEYTEPVQLGEKIEEMGEPEAVRMYYPEIYLRDVELPPLPDDEFVVKAKVCKSSVDYDEQGNVRGCSFYVKSIKFPKKGESEGDDPEKRISVMIDEGVAKMSENY